MYLIYYYWENFRYIPYMIIKIYLQMMSIFFV